LKTGGVYRCPTRRNNGGNLPTRRTEKGKKMNFFDRKSQKKNRKQRITSGAGYEPREPKTERRQSKAVTFAMVEKTRGRERSTGAFGVGIFRKLGPSENTPISRNQTMMAEPNVKRKNNPAGKPLFGLSPGIGQTGLKQNPQNPGRHRNPPLVQVE